jgi:LPXTG-motif cell wall-anchored protein
MLRVSKVLAMAGAASVMLSSSLAGPMSTASLAAGCAPYGPCATVTLTFDTASVRPGDSIRVTINGPVGDVFTVVLHSAAVTLGTVAVDSSGVGTAAFAVPTGTSPGWHTITVTDAAGNTGSASFLVASLSGAPPASNLPNTGFDSAAGVSAGAAALGVGGLVVLASRRRRRKADRGVQAR